MESGTSFRRDNRQSALVNTNLQDTGNKEFLTAKAKKPKKKLMYSIPYSPANFWFDVPLRFSFLAYQACLPYKKLFRIYNLLESAG
jgi:hypothetical protein